MKVSKKSYLILLGRALRAYRIMADMTQEEAAEKLGIDRSTISMHENGSRCPSTYSLSRYIRIYKIKAGHMAEMLSNIWRFLFDNNDFEFIMAFLDPYNNLLNRDQLLVITSSSLLPDYYNIRMFDKIPKKICKRFINAYLVLILTIRKKRFRSISRENVRDMILYPERRIK